MENLNLDDVLSHAEDHVTTPELGESNLGSEEFLKQFEVTDYKADVEWDDIIPQEELTKLKDEEKGKLTSNIYKIKLQCTLEEKLLCVSLKMAHRCQAMLRIVVKT